MKKLLKKSGIILAAIFSALLDTLLTWAAILGAGALASVVVPIVLMFATAGLAKMKLKMVR